MKVNIKYNFTWIMEWVLFFVILLSGFEFTQIIKFKIPSHIYFCFGGLWFPISNWLSKALVHDFFKLIDKFNKKKQANILPVTAHMVGIFGDLTHPRFFNGWEAENKLNPDWRWWKPWIDKYIKVCGGPVQEISIDIVRNNKIISGNDDEN